MGTTRLYRYPRYWVLPQLFFLGLLALVLYMAWPTLEAQPLALRIWALACVSFMGLYMVGLVLEFQSTFILLGDALVKRSWWGTTTIHRREITELTRGTVGNGSHILGVPRPSPTYYVLKAGGKKIKIYDSAKGHFLELAGILDEWSGHPLAKQQWYGH